MHDCPRCGQACTCSGDIDDTYVLTEAWVFMNCKCECEDEDFDLDDGLNEEFIRAMEDEEVSAFPPSLPAAGIRSQSAES